MCGISGFVVKNQSLNSFTASKIREAMGQSLSHRGPDAFGYYENLKRQVYLEHRRLSIIDLSEAGRQPFYNESREIVSLVNGEIYNFQELREELQQKGHRFSSTCDVETVVHLFEEEGPDGWRRLRGMYAIAIFDERTGRLQLSRDPLGIKPLYLYEDDQVIAFASEIRAFRLLPGWKADWNWDGISEYLLLGSMSAPRTQFKRVRALRPGETVTISGQGVQYGENGSPIPQICLSTESSAEISNDTPAKVRDVLRGSVARHLVSDVPIGIFLSGGIDSGVLAGIASEISSPRVHTLSVSLPGEPLNESVYALETAGKFETKHTEIPLDQKTFEKDFDHFFEHLDLPSIDGFNSYVVSKAARSAGLTVALSGLGGDEIFGGYNSFQLIPRLLRAKFWAGLGGPLTRSVAATSVRILKKGAPALRFSHFLRQPHSDIRDAYLACRGIFDPVSIRKLFAPQRVSVHETTQECFLQETRWAAEAVRASRSSAQIQKVIGGLEITRYMTTQLLRDTDVMSMAHGLEVRVPLVDREVIGASLPLLGQSFPGQDGHPKWLLRQALGKRTLPDSVVKRAKQGFVFPWQKWLQGRVLREFDEWLARPQPWQEMFRLKALEDWRFAYASGRAHWSTFWNLFVILKMIERESQE
jgi:asparagine synthase (glutamine-hydrolysing)